MICDRQNSIHLHGEYTDILLRPSITRQGDGLPFRRPDTCVSHQSSYRRQSAKAFEAYAKYFCSAMVLAMPLWNAEDAQQAFEIRGMFLYTFASPAPTSLSRYLRRGPTYLVLGKRLQANLGVQRVFSPVWYLGDPKWKGMGFTSVPPRRLNCRPKVT